MLESRSDINRTAKIEEKNFQLDSLKQVKIKDKPKDGENFQDFYNRQDPETQKNIELAHRMNQIGWLVANLGSTFVGFLAIINLSGNVIQGASFEHLGNSENVPVSVQQEQKGMEGNLVAGALAGATVLVSGKGIKVSEESRRKSGLDNKGEDGKITVQD